MNRILVPSDMSEIAANGLRLAVDIAKKSGAEIYLVNFTDHPMGRTFSQMKVADTSRSDEDDLFTIQLVRKNFKELGQMAAIHDSDGVTIHYEVFDEVFSKGLRMYVKEKVIDLVVMGTSGEESAAEFFTGNHAERAMETVSCPFISIREDYQSKPITDLVLGVELDESIYKADAYSRAAGYMNDFTTALEIEVDLVHVADVGAEKKSKLEKQLDDFAQYHGFQNYTTTVTENDRKEDGLLTFANAKRAGMIAVFTESTGGFLDLFDDTMSEELSKAADIPILTLNVSNF